MSKLPGMTDFSAMHGTSVWTVHWLVILTLFHSVLNDHSLSGFTSCYSTPGLHFHVAD
jgi:hypothetical protein